MNPRCACLVVAEDSPESYSPAGERTRHMALAGRFFFAKTVVLTLGRTKKQSKENIDSNVFLRTTGFTRMMPFPISALLDPIVLLAFLIHGLILSIRYKPTYIVASMPPVETGASAWFLAKLLRKKLIIDYMDDWESSVRTQLAGYVPVKLMTPTFKFAEKIYSFSAAFFVVTPTLGEIIRGRRIASSVILTPNGADTSIFLARDEKSRVETRLRHELPLNKVVVTYCGSGVNPYYRLDLILLAAKSLPVEVKENFFFAFYLYNGIEFYRKVQDRLKISYDLVEIAGPLPRNELSKVMAASDIGLVPFDDKPFLLYAMSTKVYEYLSTGLYVVGSGPNGGELDSFLACNTDCGIFVRPRTEDFVRAFVKVVENTYGLLDNSSRNLRHSFVEMNYNSRKIMVEALMRLPGLIEAT